MKDLFLHISDRIMAIAGTPVRMVDFDLGQLEREPMPPLSFPAVLVNFNAPAYISLGAGVQQAETLVTLRIAFRVWERTHSVTDTDFRPVGLAHLDILKAIHSAINNTKGEFFSPLTRVSFANAQRADLRVYTFIYSTEYYDEPINPFVPWQEIEGLGGVDFCVHPEL